MLGQEIRYESRVIMKRKNNPLEIRYKRGVLYIHHLLLILIHSKILQKNSWSQTETVIHFTVRPSVKFLNKVTTFTG